jgi:glycine hydroxymethyltransferase
VLRGPRGGMLLCGGELAERVDRAVFPFTQGGAQMHTIAAKAVAFGEAATPAFAEYARQVVANARVLAAALEKEGLAVTTGGTDTHLITADPAPVGVEGRAARGLLAAAGIVLDCCALPHGGAVGVAAADTRGLRLGTAAVTTQGMREGEMAGIGALIGAVLRGQVDGKRGREEVRELATAFPPYPG